MSLPGHATNDVQALCPCIRSQYRAFLLGSKEAGIDVATIETGRDAERQQYYVDHGTSQTLNSYHLPHPPNGLSLAFDVCPRAYLTLKGWNPGGVYWIRLGTLGRSLGLEWGGDWRGDFVDRAHFQIKKCECLPEKA